MRVVLSLAPEMSVWQHLSWISFLSQCKFDLCNNHAPGQDRPVYLRDNDCERLLDISVRVTVSMFMLPGVFFVYVAGMCCGLRL